MIPEANPPGALSEDRKAKKKSHGTEPLAKRQKVENSALSSLRASVESKKMLFVSRTASKKNIALQWQ